MNDFLASASNSASYDTLFISPSFFGYAQEIASEIELRGHKVLRFEDRPGLGTMTKLAARIEPKLVVRSMERYFATIMEAARSNPIREVLVIKGEAITISMLQRLRAALPSARFTLYFWDSFRNSPRDSRKKVALFDRAFSFDMDDARADPRLSYRPLFFLPRFTRLPALEQDIDLLFVGTIHTDRYRVLSRLKASLPASYKTEFYMYYQSPRLLSILRLVDPRFRGSSENEFIFKPLGHEAVTKLIARAKVSVDVERSVQSGYTMRTIEMMGARRKLITTNPKVVNADFYHPNNIAVIDRENPVVSEAFLNMPFEPLSAELQHRYSLAGWVDEVFASQFVQAQ